MKIEAASPADWTDIERLLSDAGLPVEDLGADKLERFLVARNVDPKRELAGAIGLECFGEFGLLRSLIVQPRLRSGGIAVLLVEALERLALQSGIEQLYLLTIDADGYFARQGYEVIGRDAAPSAIRETREFSELCPDDAVVMRKVLRDT